MKQNFAPLPLVILLSLAALQASSEDSLAVLNDSLTLGKPVVIDNVTVWPVFSSKAQQTSGDYVSLVQAQEQKTAVIHEIGSGTSPNAAGNGGAAQQQQQEGAQVNQLVIENKGDKAILVLAGTLVKGGQQDRQIGQDFIVPAGKTVPVDAYCVEHGRWTNDRDGKQTAGVFEAQKCQGNLEVRSSGQYERNQQAVWDNVAKGNLTAGKSPQSGTLMATVDETDKDALARREKIRSALLEKLKSYAGKKDTPVGIAYAVDGKVHEIRTFNDTRIFDAYTETLVNTVVLEGDLGQREALAKKTEIFKKEADVKQCVELVKAAENIKEVQVDTAAGNKNGYKKGDTVYNGNLYLKDGEKPSAAPVSQSWVSK